MPTKYRKISIYNSKNPIPEKPILEKERSFIIDLLYTDYQPCIDSGSGLVKNIVKNLEGNDNSMPFIGNLIHYMDESQRASIIKIYTDTVYNKSNIKFRKREIRPIQQKYANTDLFLKQKKINEIDIINFFVDCLNKRKTIADKRNSSVIGEDIKSEIEILDELITKLAPIIKNYANNIPFELQYNIARAYSKLTSIYTNSLKECRSWTKKAAKNGCLIAKVKLAEYKFFGHMEFKKDENQAKQILEEVLSSKELINTTFLLISNNNKENKKVELIDEIKNILEKAGKLDWFNFNEYYTILKSISNLNNHGNKIQNDKSNSIFLNQVKGKAITEKLVPTLKNRIDAYYIKNKNSSNPKIKSKFKKDVKNIVKESLEKNPELEKHRDDTTEKIIDMLNMLGVVLALPILAVKACITGCFWIKPATKTEELLADVQEKVINSINNQAPNEQAPMQNSGLTMT